MTPTGILNSASVDGSFKWLRRTEILRKYYFAALLLHRASREKFFAKSFLEILQFIISFNFYLYILEMVIEKLLKFQLNLDNGSFQFILLLDYTIKVATK